MEQDGDGPGALFARGLEVRRAVAGDSHVDAALGDEADNPDDFQRLVTEYAWGTCWSDDGLDRRQRSLITIALMAAQGRQHELEVHLRGAQRNGCTPEEIRETILHVAVYAGVPAAVDAVRAAQSVLGDPHAWMPRRNSSS